MIDGNLPFNLVEKPLFLKFCDAYNPALKCKLADSQKKEFVKTDFEKKILIKQAFQMKTIGLLLIYGCPLISSLYIPSRLPG